MSPLNNYEFRLSIHKFPIHTTREAWVKVFYDLKKRIRTIDISRLYVRENSGSWGYV